MSMQSQHFLPFWERDLTPRDRQILFGRGSFVGILDLYPGAVSAYSLRSLLRDWRANYVAKIERTSDSTDQDFTADQIKNGDLLDFTGPSDGLCNLWYDQSGYGNDAVSVSESQVSDGVAVLDSGPLFDGSDYYSISPVDLGSGSFSMFAHVVFSSGLVGGVVLGTAIGRWSFRIDTGVISFRNELGTIYNLTTDEDFEENVKYTVSLIRSGNTVNAWVNGVKQTNEFTLSASDEFIYDQIAARGAGANAFGGKLSEIIVYDSDQTANREGIEANIADYYSPKDIELFILMGQSNMVGFPSDNYPATTPLSDANDDAILFCGSAGTPINADGDLAGTSTDYVTDGWILQSAYAAQSRFGYGPNLDFSRTLANTYGRKKIGIIKFARNGTNLDVEWAKSSSQLYPTATSFINSSISELISAGYRVTIRAFFWFQGHGDSLLQDRAEAYYDNITQLASDLRSDVSGAASAKFIVGVSPEFWKLPFEAGELTADPQKVINVDTIQSAQETFATNDGAVYIQNNDAGYVEPWVSGIIGNNPIHLTTDSKQLLGIRAATAFSTNTNIEN